VRGEPERVTNPLGDAGERRFEKSIRRNPLCAPRARLPADFPDFHRLRIRSESADGKLPPAAMHAEHRERIAVVRTDDCIDLFAQYGNHPLLGIAAGEEAQAPRWERCAG
jgi:hypothetical protein